jgi:hypothetical protein
MGRTHHRIKRERASLFAPVRDERTMLDKLGQVSVTLTAAEIRALQSELIHTPVARENYAGIRSVLRKLDEWLAL